MPGLFVSEEISTKTRNTRVGSGSGSGSGTVRRRKSLGGSGNGSAKSAGGQNISTSLSSFAVKGGKPRSTVSWTVTPVVMQGSPQTPSPSVGGGAAAAASDGDGDRALRVSWTARPAGCAL